MSRKKRKLKSANVVNINDAYNNFETKEKYEQGQIKKTFHTKDLKQIYPKTPAQEDVFHSWNTNTHLHLKGSAGTGKTFLALYLALIEVLDKTTTYDRVIIVRSTLPVRDQGFLPGTEEEKSAVYQLPYNAICDELFYVKKSYTNLKANKYVEFMSTSYIRGITLNNAIIVVDEAQNCTSEELSSIITRCGRNSRMIIAGDTKQSDHSRQSDKTSLDRLERILNHVDAFDTITFNRNDIVRSKLVKQFIIAEEDYGQ